MIKSRAIGLHAANLNGYYERYQPIRWSFLSWRQMPKFLFQSELVWPGFNTYQLVHHPRFCLNQWRKRSSPLQTQNDLRVVTSLSLLLTTGNGLQSPHLQLMPAQRVLLKNLSMDPPKMLCHTLMIELQITGRRIWCHSQQAVRIQYDQQLFPAHPL